MLVGIIMFILIENAEELAYLTSKGLWSKEPGEGASFSSTRVAVAAARNQPIGRFNIVQFFASTGQLINLDRGTGKGQETRAAQPPAPSPSNADGNVLPNPAT
jgi:hypothetical protein